MKKIISNLSLSILFLFIFALTACVSKQEVIEGKYVSIYDESNYLIFNKDGSLINSLWTTYEENTPQDCYIYSIDENNMITAIDTTKYEGQNELDKYEIGLKYKDYICIGWNGVLPKTYDNVTITSGLGDLTLSYSFNKDKTYEFAVTSNNEVMHTENGTYKINKDKVVCTSESGETFTFINVNNKTYCIEYVKE